MLQFSRVRFKILDVSTLNGTVFLTKLSIVSLFIQHLDYVYLYDIPNLHTLQTYLLLVYLWMKMSLPHNVKIYNADFFQECYVLFVAITN